MDLLVWRERIAEELFRHVVPYGPKKQQLLQCRTFRKLVLAFRPSLKSRPTESSQAMLEELRLTADSMESVPRRAAEWLLVLTRNSRGPAEERRWQAGELLDWEGSADSQRRLESEAHDFIRQFVHVMIQRLGLPQEDDDVA